MHFAGHLFFGNFFFPINSTFDADTKYAETSSLKVIDYSSTQINDRERNTGPNIVRKR